MRQYAIITGSYWAFTLTDGALRMLVVLYFHQLGYSPLDIALLFLFYELFGVVTNLFGGWIAARVGLAATLIGGLVLQVGALSMLLVDDTYLTVAYVMVAQALSGVAKDLNKMSAKSSVKLIAGDSEGRLYRWVAALTGSKNALKGIGFFLGGALLSTVGFGNAVGGMAIMLGVIAVSTFFLLDRDLGKATFKPKFNDLVSKSPRINCLSAARLFLFGSRDVWFVVALPVFLQLELGWSSVAVGTLLAVWVVGYGVIQAFSPSITGSHHGHPPDGGTAVKWGTVLTGLPLLIAGSFLLDVDPEWAVVVGLIIFGAVFAINSSVHSYLIISYAESDGVSLDVGFYYMSNAAGRLVGTMCSGWVYQVWGFQTCLLVSAGFVAAATFISMELPKGSQALEPGSGNR
ncbi:MAG: MFS transporter [Gammaproteobacteria bacterium]|nr:MFS transporter [Gammaproteobacteria bacterium]RPG26638.1 MAG: MFS transporter [Gammaproteobacteria bacterium TMED50]|tara:strand:- start:4846 stop:6054 length:1209 start_codon:yes stop_codon:yes gene_type:complete